MGYWHVETDYIALLLFIIIWIKNRNAEKDRSLQGKAFSTMLIISMINVVVDIVSSTVMNNPMDWWTYQILMTIYVITMPLTGAAWLSYAIAMVSADGDKLTWRKMHLPLIPFLIYTALAVTNPVTSLFFHLTPDMVYSRGPLFLPLGVGMHLAYSLAGIFVVLAGKKQINSRNNLMLMIFCFIVASLTILIQIAHPGWLIIYAGYAVIYVLCDMTIEEERRSQLYKQIAAQNQTLKQAMAETKEANRAKTDFLSRMSHDIRTPMNGIIGMTRIASEQDNPPETVECLSKIEMSSRFLLGLVNDILDMQKAESGAIELHPEPYLMADFDKYLDSVIRPLCAEKNQTLNVETVAVATVIPIVDILRFNQIIFNLLSNAVKYTPEGGTITLTDYNELIGDHRERLNVTISDNGVGMSEDFQKVLFEPFTQEERSDSAENRGSGLGLAIVKKMVDRMGGTISVESALGKGTTFHMTFDFDYLDEDQATWKKREPVMTDADEKSLAGLHILLCEDHPMNQQIAVKLLRDKGMLVEVAENGQRGVEHFSRSTDGFFDAVLMDIRMPVMDGYEACRTIRALNRSDAGSVPIIAMTADVFKEDVDRCRAAGMDGHVPKPVEPEGLYQAILWAVKTGHVPAGSDD